MEKPIDADVFVEALAELVIEYTSNHRIKREVRQRDLMLDLIDIKCLTDEALLYECKNRDLFTVAHADDVNLLAECVRRGIRPPQSDDDLAVEFIKRGIKLTVTWRDVFEYLNHADHKELRDALQLIVTRL